MAETENIQTSTALCVSRRAFFALTAVVGSLHVVGSAFGGRVVAYADDAGNTSFLITVLSMHEIAVMAVDTANGNAPLPGVEVKVTSLFNDKTASGVTDKFGTIIMEIKDLSEEAEDQLTDTYSFWAAAEGKLAGYREFATQKMHVVGGPKDDQTATITIPTQPFNPKKDGAYVRMASFDGYDIQYNEVTFPKFPNNTADHTLTVQVGCDSGKKAQVSFLADGKVIGGPVSATADSAGIAACELFGPWVASQKIGQVFTIEFAVDGDTWTMPTGFRLEEPAVDLAEPFMTDQAEMSVGKGFIVNSPSWDESVSSAPLKADLRRNILDVDGLPGGMVLRVVADFPWCPVMFAMDPLGGIGISFNLPSVGIYNSSKGWFNNKGWLSSPTQHAKQWEKEFSKKSQKALDNYSKSRTSVKHLGVGSQFFGSADFHMDAMLFILYYPREGGNFDGSLKFMAAFFFSGCWGLQMSAGPFPFYVAFDVYVEADFGVQAGCEFNIDGSTNWYFTGGAAGEGGATVSLDLLFGLGLGIGIKGLLHAGIRGFIKLPARFLFTKPLGSEGKPFPHISFAMNSGVQVVIQVLFFTSNITVCKFPAKTIYDNWGTKASLESGEPWAPEELGPVDQGFRQTTDADLLSDRAVSNDGEGTEPEILYARTNHQGIVCNYNLSAANAAMTELSSVMAAGSGIMDPYGLPAHGADANGALYDIRKGVKSAVQGRLARKAFSDTRMQTVQLLNTVYYCRLSVVDVDVSSDSFQVCESGGLYFAIPQSSDNANSLFPRVTYKASKASAAGEETLGRLIMPKYEAVAHLDGGDEVTPPIAELNLERLGDDSIHNLNQQMQLISDMMSGAGNDPVNSAFPVKYPNLDTVPRVRVTVTPFNLDTKTFGDVDVLDFGISSASVTTTRCNINDVDFYVSVVDGYLRFGIVSAARPWDAEQTLEDQKENLFTTTLCYDPQKAAGGRISQVYSNVLNFAQEGEYEWKAIPLKASMREGDRRRDCSVLVTTGRRGGENVFVLHYYPVDDWGDLKVNTRVIYPPAGFEIDDNGILNAFVPDGVTDEDGCEVIALCWQYRQDAENAAERAAIWSVGSSTGTTFNTWELQNAHNLTVLGNGRGLVYTREQTSGNQHHCDLLRATFSAPDALDMDELIGVVDSSEFLASENGDCLYGIRLVEAAPEEPEPELLTAASQDDVVNYSNISAFVPEGASLAAKAASGAANSSSSGDLYQVVCSRWDPRAGAYHPFFALGQLSKAPDDGTLFEENAGVGVVFSTLTNLETQKADVMFTEIPLVAGVQLEGALCMDGFIQAGDTVHPVIKVTNTGNMPLSGFTVNLVDLDSSFELSAVLDDLTKPVLKPSDYASQVQGTMDTDEEGNPVNWDRSLEYVLWPGDTRQYVLEVTTPADWTGSHEISVTITDLVAADFRSGSLVNVAQAAPSQAGSGGVLRANQDGIVFLADPRDRRMLVEQEELQLTADMAVTRCDYTKGRNPKPKPKPDPKPDPTPDPKKDDSGEGTADPKNPDTGDHTVNPAVLGAATAAAGAVAIGTGVKLHKMNATVEDGGSDEA